MENRVIYDGCNIFTAAQIGVLYRMQRRAETFGQLTARHVTFSKTRSESLRSFNQVGRPSIPSLRRRLHSPEGSASSLEIEKYIVSSIHCHICIDLSIIPSRLKSIAQPYVFSNVDASLRAVKLAMSQTMMLCLLSVFTASAYSATVQSGLDVLQRSGYDQLAGHKVLILTNPTGVTPQLELGVDVMVESGNVNLVGIMGPEHGFRGTAQAGGSTDTFIDEKTGLTVYDAYNADVDTLIGFILDSGADMVLFDIQDVGARFYTYIWAMHDTMVAAAASNTTFMVLDRPNPITGLNAFGPVLDRAYSSYVGRQPIAQAHGMTAGELAKMFAGEGWIKREANDSDIDLKVVQMHGWKRWMTWRDTGLPWVPPSPNMPTPDTAQIYPGACMFEGTTLSEGRGTTRPFELLGAPFANASWREAMSQLSLPHTKYRFACFEPSISKFAEHTCCGIQTYWSLDSIRDHEEFDPVNVGVALLSTAHQLYASKNDSSNETANFDWVSSASSSGTEYNIDLLTGGSWIRKSIDEGMSPTEIKMKWTPDLQHFKTTREKYLLY